MKPYPFVSKPFLRRAGAASAALAALFSVLASSPSAASAAAQFPAFPEVRERLTRSETALLDRHGELLHEVRTNARVRQLGWTRLGDVSAALKKAVVFSEDQRFFDHSGVDWLALAKSAGSQLVGLATKKRGASTISMQVAALLDQSLASPHGRRGVGQKLSQIWGAVELERNWTKDQILETYLNLVFFRGELQGIGTAARGLFGKAPHGLTLDESLVLASLIRAPQASEPVVRRRACSLGQAMDPAYSCEALGRFLDGRSLVPRSIPHPSPLPPSLVKELIAARTLKTSLDRRLQADVLDILQRQVLGLKDRNVNDAAAIVLDNRTGEVLAYVGGLRELSSASQVDGARSRRQAGSTLKPFLYGIALERRYLTPSSTLDDSAADISLGDGYIYRPRDFDHQFHGPDVTVRMALGSSLNVPAVRTLNLIGVGTLVRRLSALGFERLESEEHYGPSLALGTADVTLGELTNGYRALANGGVWSPVVFASVGGKALPGPRRRVFSAEAAFLVSDILSDKESRGLTFGLDNPMASRFWSAVKTGTSKDMRDNWCVGYSSRYTVGVWVGNFSGKPMWNVTGVSGAAPAWAQVMERLHADTRSTPPKPPKNVIRRDNDWYIRGTEPAPRLATASPGKPSNAIESIVYPADGTIVARDPDIPASQQRLFFEARPANSALHWELNGEPIGTAGEALSWPLGRAGDYVLKLVTANGKALDHVDFSIRGQD